MFFENFYVDAFYVTAFALVIKSDAVWLVFYFICFVSYAFR